MEQLRDWITTGEYGRMCAILAFCGVPVEEVGARAMLIIKRIGPIEEVRKLKSANLTLEEAAGLVGSRHGSLLKLYIDRIEGKCKFLSMLR